MSLTNPQKEGTQFLLFFIFAISLMVVDHYSQLLSNFRNTVLTVMEPVEKIASWPINSYHYFQQDFETIDSLKKANQKLATENLLLKAKQQQFSHLTLEVKRLNELLGTASQLDSLEVKVANITHYQATPYSHTYTLNKGALDGVKINQSVIDSFGLLGLITQLTPTSSKVQLISDTDIKVPVRIQRTGQRGVTIGIDKNTLSLQFIANTSSVKVGDLIETSGLGGIYPKGYPVATITKITTLKDQPYFAILAKPVARIGKTEKVLILSDKVEINPKDTPNLEQK